MARLEGTQNAGPRLGGPMMKQPTFNWEAEGKYNEHKNFRLELNNIFKSYSMPQVEQIAIIKKWLGRKGLQFLESLTQMEQKDVTQQKISLQHSTINSNHNIMRP